MTDSHSVSNAHEAQASTPTSGHTPHPAKPQYEGTDPELHASAEQSGRRVNVSTVQVGASAAAAVTSALAASFFGVAGTLIGAAVGSIVSTIAGALYADYLRKAGQRITKSVVIQRIPSEVLASTPLRHLTSPSDLPGEPSMRPIGDEIDDESVSLPLSSPTELLAETGDARQTMLMPAYGTAEAEAIFARSSTADRPVTNGSAKGSVDGSSDGRPGSVAPAADQRTGDPRPWWKRPMVTMSAVGIAGFAIAIGAVSAAELINGGPISGGKGGTSLSKVVTPGKHTSKTTITDVTPTATPGVSGVGTTPDPGTTTEPTTPASPTASSAPQDPVTTAPASEPTDPGAAATPAG
jgi:hypothetical protein